MKSTAARKLKQVPMGYLVIAVDPYLTAKLGAGKKEEWGLPTDTVISFRSPEPLTKTI